MQFEIVHDRGWPARSAAPATAVTVVVAAVAMLQATARWGIAGAAIAGSVAVAAGGAAADARYGRIPNAFVALTAVPPLGFVAFAVGTGRPVDVLVAVGAGATVFGAPMFAVHVVDPDALGFGDVKLGAALGAALGLVDPRLGLVAVCVATAVTAVAGVAARRPSMPLGPGLVVGAGTVLVAAARLQEGSPAWR